MKEQPQTERTRDSLYIQAEVPYSVLQRVFSPTRMREVLTHSSYYEQDATVKDGKGKGNGRSNKSSQVSRDEGKGNSRLVFAGMFVFRGMVAEVLFRYFPAEGTQLQHILGNLFRQERLERMYEEQRLEQYVRAGERFDISKHRHIFVYALFGYVSTLGEDLRQWFISRYILNKESSYLFHHRTQNRDLLAQADYLAQQTKGLRLTIETIQQDDGLYSAKALLSDGMVLVEATSKSYRYARTKAVKQAIDILAKPLREAMLQDEDYQARVRARKEEEKAARRAAIEARDAAKEELRKQKKAARKVLAQERDLKRRQSQAAAKVRKAENARRAALKAAKESRPMSANKRRYLEDKKK